MFRLDGSKPGDERGFFHKRLLGLAGGVIKRAIPGASVAFDIIGAGKQIVAPSPVPQIAPGGGRTFGRGGTKIKTALQKKVATDIKFGAEDLVNLIAPPAECPRGTRPDPRGFCVSPESDFGGRSLGPARGQVGEAVLGQFGAALEPGVMVINRSVCLPGMQLAKDGLCYNKGAITNSQRMWPRGRRPLLTGGDMSAISQASRAANKLSRTTKRLQQLGMMKKAPTRRSLPRPHVHALPKGS